MEANVTIERARDRRAQRRAEAHARRQAMANASLEGAGAARRQPPEPAYDAQRAARRAAGVTPNSTTIRSAMTSGARATRTIFHRTIFR